MPTANEQLLHQAIDHAVDLQAYSNHEVRRIITMLNRADGLIFQDLQKALDRLSATSFTVQRLETLLASVRAMNKAAFEEVGDQIALDLRDLVEVEANFQAKSFDEAIPEPIIARVGIAPIVPEQVFAAAMAQPFQGVLLKGVLTDLSATRAKRIRETIANGFVSNRTTDQIVRDLRGTRALKYEDGIFNRSRREVEAVVRTAVGHTAAFTRDRFEEANAALIKAVSWVSTLDGRTTPMCRIRDGLEYTRGDHKPIGHNVPWLAGPSRLHWSCRSTSAPVAKSFRELGLDVDDFTPATRASMDGQVPASQTYSEWLGKQSPARQDDILGPTRGKLLREGGLKLEGFANDKGRWLTLQELRARDSAKTPLRAPPAVMEPEDVLPKALLQKTQKVLSANREIPDDAKPVGLTVEQKDIAARQLARSIEAAHAAKPAFDAQLDAIGAKVAGRVSVAGVKGGERLLEKHVLENNSDPANMRDLVRGSVVVRQVSDVSAVLAQIEKNFTVTRIKDRFAKPLATGYSDMLINVRLPGGIDGEIQVHIPEMIAAKKLGHKVYDIERKLPDSPEKDRLVKMQSEIYSAALQANKRRKDS